jgi:hypothetical protein
MLGIGDPDRHALPCITPIKCADRALRSSPARAGSFFGTFASLAEAPAKVGSPPRADLRRRYRAGGGTSRLGGQSGSGTGRDLHTLTTNQQLITPK